MKRHGEIGKTFGCNNNNSTNTYSVYTYLSLTVILKCSNDRVAVSIPLCQLLFTNNFYQILRYIVTHTTIRLQRSIISYVTFTVPTSMMSASQPLMPSFWRNWTLVFSFRDTLWYLWGAGSDTEGCRDKPLQQKGHKHGGMKIATRLSSLHPFHHLSLCVSSPTPSTHPAINNTWRYKKPPVYEW